MASRAHVRPRRLPITNRGVGYGIRIYSMSSADFEKLKRRYLLSDLRSRAFAWVGTSFSRNEAWFNPAALDVLSWSLSLSSTSSQVTGGGASTGTRRGVVAYPWCCPQPTPRPSDTDRIFHGVTIWSSTGARPEEEKYPRPGGAAKYWSGSRGMLCATAAGRSAGVSRSRWPVPKTRAGTGLLTECDHAFFAAAWREVLPGLAADARHKSELLTRRGVAGVLRAVSPAVGLDTSEAGRRRIVVGKLQDNAASGTHEGGDTFIPTAFGRPHLVVVRGRGRRPVFQYPVATAAALVEPAAGPDAAAPGGARPSGPSAAGQDAGARRPHHGRTRRQLAADRTRGVPAPVGAAEGWIAEDAAAGRYVLYELDLPVSERLGGGPAGSGTAVSGAGSAGHRMSWSGRLRS